MRNKTGNASAADEIALRDGLAEIYAKTESWRLTGIAIRASGSYARLLVLGKRRPTLRVLAAWQEWTTQRPIEYAPVPVCPIHGEPHVADCHGAPVAEVVTLAPGERVQRLGKPSQPRPACFRPRLALDLATRITQLETLLQAARKQQLEEGQCE